MKLLFQRMPLDWRFTTNDAAPRDLFDPDALKPCTSRLREFVGAELNVASQPLGNALDQFYLRQRMRHWACGSISRAMTNRLILAPFFHADYLAWADHLPVEGKFDSRAFNNELTQIDPQLAAIPMDSMLIPSQLSDGGLMARMSLMRTKASKLKTKIMQRVAGARNSSLGANQFQTKLCTREIVEELNWAGLESTGLFRAAGLSKLRDEKLAWSRVMLGYLFGMQFQLKYLSNDYS